MHTGELRACQTPHGPARFELIQQALSPCTLQVLMAKAGAGGQAARGSGSTDGGASEEDIVIVRVDNDVQEVVVFAADSQALRDALPAIVQRI